MCFVQRHSYVNDGLTSFPTSAEAIAILKDIQELLAASNLRLHKIVLKSRSQSPLVRSSLGKAIITSSLLESEFPVMQRSLGVSWDINKDTFTFQVYKVE